MGKILSFIIELAIVIILAKFFLVSVVSGSMEHSGMSEQDIAEYENLSFHKGINTGDLILLIPSIIPTNISEGDVIIFKADGKHIIHRVTSSNPLETKGDANNGQSPYELNISKEDVVGKAIMRVPWLGYVKIWAVNVINGLF